MYPEQRFPSLWQHTQIMGRHQQLRETMAETQNEVKGIAVYWRGLFLKIIELLQDRWQQNPIFIVKTLFPQKKKGPGKLHKSNIHGRDAIAKVLITENNARRWKVWFYDQKKNRRLMTGNTSYDQMSYPSRCSQQQAGLMSTEHSRKPIILTAGFQLWNM